MQPTEIEYERAVVLLPGRDPEVMESGSMSLTPIISDGSRRASSEFIRYEVAFTPQIPPVTGTIQIIAQHRTGALAVLWIEWDAVIGYWHSVEGDGRGHLLMLSAPSGEVV
jgi:hypothetical protein